MIFPVCLGIGKAELEISEQRCCDFRKLNGRDVFTWARIVAEAELRWISAQEEPRTTIFRAGDPTGIRYFSIF